MLAAVPSPSRSSHIFSPRSLFAALLMILLSRGHDRLLEGLVKHFSPSRLLPASLVDP